MTTPPQPRLRLVETLLLAAFAVGVAIAEMRSGRSERPCVLCGYGAGDAGVAKNPAGNGRQAVRKIDADHGRGGFPASISETDGPR